MRKKRLDLVTEPLLSREGKEEAASADHDSEREDKWNVMME